jgi:hypothetical protein
MHWPHFDAAEALNQVIGGVVTIASVVLGARIAFTHGLRHLRHERALDRRLDWYEKLLAALDEYRSILRVLVSIEGERLGGTATEIRSRDHVLRETTASGRRFANCASLVNLYGTAQEQEQARALQLAQMSIYVHSWGLREDGDSTQAHFADVKAGLGDLDSAYKRFTELLRRELVLNETVARRPWRGARKS